jgi:hypothetical protein
MARKHQPTGAAQRRRRRRRPATAAAAPVVHTWERVAREDAPPRWRSEWPDAPAFVVGTAVYRGEEIASLVGVAPDAGMSDDELRAWIISDCAAWLEAEADRVLAGGERIWATGASNSRSGFKK